MLALPIATPMLSQPTRSCSLRHPLSSLRGRLTTLVLVSTLPLAACAAMALAVLLRHEEARAISRALETNRQTAIAVQVTLNRSFAVLDALAQSPLLDGTDLAPFAAMLERVLPVMPGSRSLLLAAPDGQLLLRASAGPRVTLHQPVEPSSFAQMLERPAPVVGQLGQGPSGTWAIPLRVPVMRDGKLRYVLTTPLLPATLADVLGLQKLPEGWTVVVFDNNGRRIARVPERGFVLGDQVSPDLLALVRRSQAEEGSGITHTSAGEEVYTAYVRLPQSGWTLATGIPTREVSATVTRALLLYGGGLALSLVLASLAAWFAARGISRPMAQLREAAKAVGRGETPEAASCAIKEIREVGEALEHSARALATSEQARGDALAHLAAAHQDLMEADRRKDEFIATLAHELRNPLVPVRQAAALLRHSQSEPARVQNLAVIDRQLGHMARLLDDLLDAARFNFGDISLRPDRLDIVALLRDALGFVREKATDKHILLSEGLPRGAIYVEGDALRLQQLFVNLLDNAVKYTGPGGRVTLSARAGAGQVEVTVTDNGRGLAPEQMEGIFRLFGRVASLGSDAGGLGVGLALARRLVELHGGELSVHSPGLGQGSEFVTRLPLAGLQSAPVEVQAAPPATIQGPTGRRVLVADDNTDIAATLQALLELEGHQVRLAFDGAQAVRLCETAMPEVAILDIGMPGLDGHQAARAIRALPEGHLPYLIAVSGWGQAEDVQAALSAGFDKHLTKPADLDELLMLVATGRRNEGMGARP